MKNNLIGISGRVGSGKDTVGKILQYLNYFKFKDLNERQTCEYFLKNNHIEGFGNSKWLNNQSYQIKKFADKREDIVCMLLGCTREQLEDREFKEKELGEEWWYFKITNEGKSHLKDYTSYPEYKIPVKLREEKDTDYVELIKLTPRKLLQLLGTGFGRDIHPNIRVNALFADYKVRYIEEEATEGNKQNGSYIKKYKPNWIITDVEFPNDAQAIKDRGGIVIRVNRDKFSYQSDLPETASPIEHAERGKELYYHPSEAALDDYEFDAVIDNDGSIEELVEKVKQLNLV